MREMAGPSLWVMVTTALGFGSLILVPAQPLRELGTSGVLGAIVALVVTYVAYPSFLQLAKPPPAAMRASEGRIAAWLSRYHVGPAVALLLLGVLLASGVRGLNRDPSLLAYFDSGGAIRQGLEHVDRNGGSSPLRLVVRDPGGRRLDDKQAYERLWALHEALERHPAVGTALSLPLIMSEAKRAPFAFLFSHRFRLEKMEEPQYGGVTHAFVTEDRKRALFLLRMKEAPEAQDRLRVVEELQATVRRHGFEAELTGGLFYLQGRLASLVVSSLITGVGQLLAVFLVVALVVSRSLRSSVALVVTLALVPAIVLGVLGHLRVPLDIISAPAINIALGMAIDDMLHLTHLARRLRRDGAPGWEAWARARAEHWQPVLGTMTVVACGFAIFALSSFPPTRRFGMAVVGGALLDVVACLFVLPLLAGAPLRWPAALSRRVPRLQVPEAEAHSRD